MTEQDEATSQAQEEFVRWVREQHQSMGSYAGRNGLVLNDAEGLPVWSVPNRVFLGKIREKGNHEAGYWIISGEMPTDHIELRLAGTAREAARHFTLKWQLQGARIGQGGSHEDDAMPPDWANVSDNLARSAEALAELVEDDQYWVNVTDT